MVSRHNLIKVPTAVTFWRGKDNIPHGLNFNVNAGKRNQAKDKRKGVAWKGDKSGSLSSNLSSSDDDDKYRITKNQGAK